MTLAVKCTMIVQGAVHLTENAVEPDTKTLLRVNHEIWEKAVALFKNLSKHLTTTDIELSTIQTAYDDFLNLLKVRCFLV